MKPSVGSKWKIDRQAISHGCVRGDWGEAEDDEVGLDYEDIKEHLKWMPIRGNSTGVTDRNVQRLRKMQRERELREELGEKEERKQRCPCLTTSDVL
ncbi:hypothetical protein JG687_00004535 [Phytophthora cactorum]|uniref:Uncharacterized protein n=1 Tax=Phytophthora cactorum TaxID=29920 RepID=A0A329S9H9_9STRA|nr:hypothetical protein Pcac1_g26771 [Phytophthora cactorum]KAG2821636.1 hypothetical protein PC112_g11268 [Phytophthora cactorum]KAG2824163.1 hypothetical protein PC111_g9928 [Phytophthora cactorum]KAG2856186.1 hypothetical protein PC113_g11786 [Phytophthora cactorum]KAG2903369.1 hypothetical protein PC114_g12311 [Phytophthora cactorum]